MLKTIKECCGKRCQWEPYPIARLMLCGREVTEAERDRAKAAFISAVDRGDSPLDLRDAAGEEHRK